MLKPILDATEPSLRKKSKPVKRYDKKVKNLIKNLTDTLLAQDDPEGVGLAAPQIGKNVRVFVMRYKKSIKAIVNPKIVSISKKNSTRNTKRKILEGCLSLPHLYGPLSRPESIKIQYLSENGKKVTEKFTDFPAHIVQHEIDHLNGFLFVDRLIEQKKPLYEYDGDNWNEVDLPR